jgi:GTPase SAR1 family protein
MLRRAKCHPFVLNFADIIALFCLFSKQWQPEVQRANASGRPVILIGTKCDLRNDPDALQRLEARHLAPVSFDQGLKLARQIGAVAYVECASNLSNGLSDLSETLNNFLNGGSKAKGKSKSSNASKSQSKRGGCTLL